MLVLLGIALKSLLIAGTTLGLLALMKRRSAAERSWVAHIGLVALVLLALAPLVLPSWTVETPSLLGETTVQAPVDQSATTPIVNVDTTGKSIVRTSIEPTSQAVAPTPAATSSGMSLSTVAAATAIYAVPAAILLVITLLALARLIALRARAEVLVDGHWLSALARAQRRMGFKHGTALLTSNELASPISWGLMRPVILLNNRAVEASGEAEAIIAHELAHVARMDWIKLLLARIATALFWFNPFVWMLAREAHQLREEAADDAVLAADIPDTEYAELLVGVARHECPGMLLGAHGVAPSRSSLARRVARVLDVGSVRGPVARSFALGVFVGAVAIAAPLAALTLTPKGTAANAKLAAAGKQDASAAGIDPYYAGNSVPTDLPSIISQGVATSVESAVAAINPNVDLGADFEAVSQTGASVRTVNGKTELRAPNGATTTIYPPDAQGRRRVVMRSETGAVLTFADASQIPGGVAALSGGRDRQRDRDDEPTSAVERAIGMKALGVTPEYIAAIKAASPALRDVDADEIMGMKAVGVTPEYIRDLASVGLRNLDAEDLTGARAVGVNSAYVRSMAAAGLAGDLDDYVEMRALGITPAYAEKFRKAGYKVDKDKLVKLKAHDIDIDELRRTPPERPRPPRDEDEDDADGG